MKATDLKNYHISHTPEQDEVTILGGRDELTEEVISKVASSIFRLEKYEMHKAEVFDASQARGWVFKYYHYVLSYGPKSRYNSKHPDYREPNQK